MFQDDPRALVSAGCVGPADDHLIDRLKVDPMLRRLCGWSRVTGPSRAGKSRHRSLRPRHRNAGAVVPAEGEEKPLRPGHLMFGIVALTADQLIRLTALSKREAWRGLSPQDSLFVLSPSGETPQIHRFRFPCAEASVAKF